MRKKDECTHNDHIEVFHRWQISRSKISSDVVRMVHDVFLHAEDAALQQRLVLPA